MKKIGLLIVLFISLNSCSNDDSDNKADAVVTDYYGKWVQYNEPKSDHPSSNQYSYVFNKDNTFSKTRIYESINVTLTGTFEIIIQDNLTRFVLTYKEKKENSFISNCGGGLIESFTLDKSSKLIDDARACDAAFVFKKAN
ncbi:hypothetical protein [Flavobacterium anhuiense]|uniref:hypothetical protein n=1 Tax=Flavobacterium anhuiense TaxID=459526 RepID=UPI003D988CE5